MNHSKYKYIFLFFGVIYLIGGFFTLFSTSGGNYSLLGFSITKTQEMFRQFLVALILLFAFWKQTAK